MQCTKVIEGEKQSLKQYKAGDVFGELALLYNAPRAATIQAETESLLWVLDRQTFNHIVKDASQKKREKYENFLSTVPILQNMDHYERSKLADAIKEKKFTSGSQVIKQGEQGDSFYILVDGDAYVTLNASGDEVVMIPTWRLLRRACPAEGRAKGSQRLRQERLQMHLSRPQEL